MTPEDLLIATASQATATLDLVEDLFRYLAATEPEGFRRYADELAEGFEGVLAHHAEQSGLPAEILRGAARLKLGVLQRTIQT